MASSSIPLSLLAKGIGQLSKNGHERLDVYLEPEDYYNLQSQYQKYQLRALRRQAGAPGTNEQFEKAHEIFPLHKTFLTRKGALLLFSEELAKKALEEQSKREEKLHKDKHDHVIDELPTEAENETEVLRTCNDLSWAILRYGKPEYRRKGDDLYLRFIHEAKGKVRGRSIRPGFSPKRYISTWSKSWDDGMLQKLRSGGMISDKTLYRQNPLLPHLYKYASYNLSSNPPPYRVTRNMLLPPGNVPSYDFYRARPPHQTVSIASREIASKAPPPSQLDDPVVDPDPLGTIQAVRYHESGEIQEVTYAELKPQEKQEILAELLIAAHEHQQHIRDTLELVMSTNRHRAERSDQGATSSASSELMADMHRAIMSLVESPIRQQMRERQKLLREQEEKQEEERRQQQLQEEKKQKRREERKAKKAAEAKRAAEEAAKAKKAKEEAKLQAAAAKERRKAQEQKEETTVDPQKAAEEEAQLEEKRLKEERKRKRREEREARRKMREKVAHEAQEKEEATELADEQSAPPTARPPSRDEHREREGEDRKAHKHRKHRHRDESIDDAKAEEKRKREERRSRRRSEKEAAAAQQMKATVGEMTESGVVKETSHPGPTGLQPKVYVRATKQHSATEEHYVGQSGERVYAVLPPDGVTEIQHADASERPKLHRRMAGIPIPVPVNTPAVDTRSIPDSLPQEGIEYEEVILLEKPKRRRRSNGSSVDEYKSRTRSNRLADESRDDLQSAPRSIASSQSSGPKQILFAPEIPDDGTSSQKQGSFYGGRMPITSNLVKQTLSDKVSIISASQESVSGLGKMSQPPFELQSNVARQSIKSSMVSDKIVPSIGIEPATPLNPKQSASPIHQPSIMSSLHKSVPGTQYLSPTSSFSGSHRSLGRRSEDNEGQRSQKRRDSMESSDSGAPSKKLPSKRSDDPDDERDSDGDDDSSSQSSFKVSVKSSKPEVASKYSQTTSQSSKKKSKHTTLPSDHSLSTSSKSWLSKDATKAPVYTGLKGQKGPGSQSSSSMLKSSTTKKSHSTRGSLPSSMKRGERGIKASVRMPDGEFVSVGGSLTRSDEIPESEVEGSDETASVDSKSSGQDAKPSLPKSSLKSSAKVESKVGESSGKDTRRVSFHDTDVVVGMTTDTEDEDKQASSVSVSDYDVTEEESEEADEWPAVKEEVASVGAGSSQSRPVSSRSEKLTAHAQKVAAMVVKKQRPDSGLDEDAKKAAKLWNKAVDESDVTSSSEEEEEEEEEWAGAKEPVVSITSSSKPSKSEAASSKPSSEDAEEVRRKEKLEKLKAEKLKDKEIRPSVSMTTSKKTSTVSGSTTSIASSVSSVQEAFVSEIQRKASDLGIEPKDLDFQADVVNKLEQSTITPEEVEVVHDVESGKHIVRSRKSSTSASSVLTPSTVDKQPPREVAQEQPITKQKLVVDLKLEKQASASPSRSSSVTSSMTSQSPTSGRSSVSQRRSSIPVDKVEVKLDYDVTSYESKLGDPKPEEPTIQAARPHVEPEKIKNVETSQAAKSDAVSRLKAGSVKPSGTGSVKSMQSSSSKATGKAAPGSKAPQKKILEKKLDKAEVSSSIADSTKKSESHKSQKEAKAATQAERGSKKGDGKKKAKSKPKAEESVPSEKEAPTRVTPEKQPTKTPETPFRAGQSKQPKPDEYMSSAVSPEEKESIASVKKEKSKKPKKKDFVTQVEKDAPKPKEKEKAKAAKDLEPPKKADTPKAVTPAPSPSKASEPKPEEEEEDYPEYVTPVSQEDDYEFVRAEDTPEPTPEPPAPSPPKTPAKSPVKQDDTTSQVSETTALTEATATGTEHSKEAEDEAEREAKLAAKQAREQKRAAAAEKRRQEVERKRREKEDQMKREKEEQERQEKMKDELEAERKKREEAIRLRKEEAEREKQREKEEEELRQRRLLQQQERERKQQEEYKRKMEELQKKKREEEERKREEAKRLAEEEAARKKAEEELMAEMEESERELYAQRKREEEEERQRKAEEARIRREEEMKIKMEQERVQALIRSKQAAALEEKLRFVREFFTEANGMDQTQNVNRSFTFSYFELMRMLGLDVLIE